MAIHGRVDSPEALGLMLQQGRLLRKRTQDQVAEDLEISQRYVSEVELGKPSLYTERLFKMMREAGVTLTAEIAEPEDIDAATDRHTQPENCG